MYVHMYTQSIHMYVHFHILHTRVPSLCTYVLSTLTNMIYIFTCIWVEGARKQNISNYLVLRTNAVY